MIIRNFIKKIFCLGESKNNIQPIVNNNIPDENLTKIERNKLPLDEFLCSKCEKIPEILDINSNTNKICFECHKHWEIPISVEEYLNALNNSSFTYLNKKCLQCEGIKKDIAEKIYFCCDCKKYLCDICIEKCHMTEKEKNYLIPIEDKKNKCNVHANETADLYCLDCEEIICKKNKSHENHATFNTSKMLNDVNRSRKIIEDKISKLFNMIRLLRLINSKGNKESKKQLKEAIENEEKRIENDVDLAIYYLKHKELEEKLSKENKGGEVLIKN